MIPYAEPLSRWCSQHREHFSTEGGRYILMNKGMSRRWICGRCLENIASRKKTA